MTVRAETRIDRSSSALEVKRSARDGVVHLRVPLTWIGVRAYKDPETGEISRELRRPEQVWAKSHIDSLQRLTATHGHPSEKWGTNKAQLQSLPVMLDARAEADSPPGPDGVLRRPPGGLQVGQVGDRIEAVKIDGFDIPVAAVAIHGAAAVADIEAGKTQTSLGYGCLVDRTPGEWTDAAGKVHPYDAEHVLDAEDPRVIAAVARGFDAATLGANHLAVAISRGRGGNMSELLKLDAWIFDDPPDGLGEPRLFAMMRAADESGVSGTGRVMDGVLWPDGHVVTRWRSDTPGGENFDTWSLFHATHCCAHPGNGTETPFADGQPPPECIACGETKGAEEAPAGEAEGAVGEAAPVGSYPLDVATFLLPTRLRDLADKLTAKGSKIAAKTDGFEVTLPPSLDPTVAADMFAAMAESLRGMSADLTAADTSAGEQAAALATAKDANAKLAADAAEVAPLLVEARKGKRDAAIAEAKLVAPKMDAVPDDADEVQIKRLAVKARLGDALKRDTADLVEGAYAGLLAAIKGDTAGGKDRDDGKDKAGDKGKQKTDAIPPVPPIVHAPNAQTPDHREDADADAKLDPMYRTDADE